MASIIARKRKDGSTAYRADIRIKRKGRLVYQESRTFDRKAMAKDWSQRREVKLQDPAELRRATLDAGSLGSLISRYRKEFGGAFGATKESCLSMLEASDLADTNALSLTSADYINHVQARRAMKVPHQDRYVGGSTVLQDLLYLRVVLKTARSAWGIPVDITVLEEAIQTGLRERLLERPGRRDRRPTVDELDKILTYMTREEPRRKVPHGDIILFGLFSARREDEITRVRWDSLDERLKSGIVSEMKHPRDKARNHRAVFFTDEAWAIIQRQPRTDDRIFPYKASAISARFTSACKFLGIEDLRFHDLRHECISWLFERGWDIPRVAQVSGHQSWSSLQRYTHLHQHGDYDKYGRWEWRPRIEADEGG